MHIIIRYVFKGSVYIFYPRPQNDPDRKTIMIQLFFFLLIFRHIKGTVSVKSSDPSCKDDNTRFATLPFKP